MALEAAFPDPYTDPNITFRNPPAQTITPTPPRATHTTLGKTTVYDVAGTDHTPDNSDAPAQPKAPNRWVRGRDPYANGGMVSQPQFSNQA